MFGPVIVILLVALIALLAFALTKPDRFRVQRATEIRAPADRIFPLINDFRNWTQWSPYENRDPGLKRTYSGAASGTGAAYEWEGNKDVGKGEMKIIETVPPSKVAIDLHFITPFEAHNTAIFTLAPEGERTQVVWAMEGRNNFMSKLMGLFVNMDKMIGKDFETGLATLKTVAERS